MSEIYKNHIDSIELLKTIDMYCGFVYEKGKITNNLNGRNPSRCTTIKEAISKLHNMKGNKLDKDWVIRKLTFST